MRKILLSAALLTISVSSAAAWASAGTGQRDAARTPAAVSQQLATTLSQVRLATAKYATSLSAAKANGYQIITRMIPNMGYHYLNPKIAGFNPTKPAILVYLKHGGTWQLGAVEWVFTEKPKTAPLAGARYGAFAAACHYADGTFVPAQSQDACPKTAPQTGAAFGFWHPNLITLHVWLWYPNPSGLYSDLNPLVRPFNAS